MTSNHKITVTCKKYILRVLVALAAVVLFHPLLNALFTKMLSVLPIEFGELYVDVAIVGLTLLGAVFISLKWFEKHKYKLFVIWGFGVFLHLLDTFYWQDWDYAPMSFPMINYVVYFLYVLPFVFVIKSIVEKAHYSRIKETKTEKLNDSFGYTVHAKKLLEFIKNRKSRDSYAIGINAKWGEGKSFFIDLFKEELANSKSNEELIVVDFKPWFSHSPLDIINDFFTVFGERLEEEGIYIQSDLEKYKEALMGVETDEPILNQLLKSVKGLFDNDSKSSSLLYERINNVLKEENRRIIVVIDDLDRLTKEELFEVIKLVRNSGSLKNTFFVLAYDRTYLEEALESLQIGKHDKYLEKVIQMELKLPSASETYLDYASKYVLREYKQSIDVWDKFVELTRGIEVFHVDNYSIRTVEYFIDKIVYEIKEIEEEVNFSDYCIIYLLRENKDFKIQEFLEIIMSTDDTDELCRKILNMYSTMNYIGDLCICLTENINNKHSFLGNVNRWPLYLKVFVLELNYIPEQVYISLITNKQKGDYKDSIKYLQNNINWTNDFINRLKSINTLKKEHKNQDVAKNIINIFNEILKDDGIFSNKSNALISKRVGPFYNFIFHLKDVFGLSAEQIKELFLSIEYACYYRASMLGFHLRGWGEEDDIKKFSEIITRDEILDINTNFLRLALEDKRHSPSEQMGYFWELLLEPSKGKNYIFHNEGKTMMLEYIAKHIDDFGEVILSDTNEYRFHELFENLDEFYRWLDINELNEVDIVKEYKLQNLYKRSISLSQKLRSH